jgi:dephospho-CoA kinase
MRNTIFVRMKIIGITGGIGSGKTTVCGIFQSFGVPVFHADDEAKKVYQSPAVQKEVNRVLEDHFFPAGVLDAKKLAGAVFGSPDKLEALNTIVHPAVRRRFAEWLKVNSASPYVIREAAILFESGADADCDEVLFVSAPEEVRIQRVMQRDAVSAEEVKLRLMRQWPEEKKRALADEVIENDGIRALMPECLRLHEKWSGISSRG